MVCTSRPVTTLGYLVELLSIHPALRVRLPSHLQPHHRFSIASNLHHSKSAWEAREALRNHGASREELKEVLQDPASRFDRDVANVEFKERKGGRKKSQSSEEITEKHGDSDAGQVASMESAPAPATLSKHKRSPPLSRPPATRELKHRQELWQIQKRALASKFGDENWTPRKRLSPDTLDGIRTMHASDPEKFTTPILAEHFRVSPEAIRRILKSKWQPRADEMEERRRRWEKRGEKIWTQLAEIGTRPPKKWREMGVGKGEAGEAPRWKSKPERAQRGKAVGRPVDIAVKDVLATRRRDGNPTETFSDRIL